MAKAVLTSGGAAAGAAPHRPRTSSILAGIAFVFLATVGAIGIDWGSGTAMIIGEIVGVIAPVALIALAGLIIYRINNRTADRS